MFTCCIHSTNFYFISYNLTFGAGSKRSMTAATNEVTAKSADSTGGGRAVFTVATITIASSAMCHAIQRLQYFDAERTFDHDKKGKCAKCVGKGLGTTTRE